MLFPCPFRGHIVAHVFWGLVGNLIEPLKHIFCLGVIFGMFENRWLNKLLRFALKDATIIMLLLLGIFLANAQA